MENISDFSGTRSGKNVAQEPRSWICNENDYKIVQQLAMLEAKQTLLEGTVAMQKAMLEAKQILLEKTVAEQKAMLEAKQTLLERTVADQKTEIKDLSKQIADMKQNVWGSWAEWGQCEFSCTRSANEGVRFQTRSRTMTVGSNVQKEETDQRPCNAVQFAGCDKSSSAGDNYATAFSFTDEIAQATCTAIRDAGGDVRALRRTCSNQTVSCEDLCKSLSLTCFNALHVYQPQNVLGRQETGKAGLRTHRYNSCGGSYCGPNFCCCSS